MGFAATSARGSLEQWILIFDSKIKGKILIKIAWCNGFFAFYFFNKLMHITQGSSIRLCVMPWKDVLTHTNDAERSHLLFCLFSSTPKIQNIYNIGSGSGMTQMKASIRKASILINTIIIKYLCSMCALRNRRIGSRQMLLRKMIITLLHIFVYLCPCISLARGPI